MTTAQEEGFNIILLVNTKGGAGKSSLAKILVSATLASSRNAFFIDIDMALLQGSRRVC
jgi:cellulose biosynthesis protein BcsQ